MKVRIPLVGQPNQRNLDSLQALIEGKDQRYKNGLIIPIHNSLAGTVKHYFEKRPGIEQGCIAAAGCVGNAIKFSPATGKTIAVFCEDQIYVDCVSAGTLDVPPADHGDGRFLAVSDVGT